MAIQLAEVFLVDWGNGLLEQVGRPFALHAGRLPRDGASQLLLKIARDVTVPVSVLALKPFRARSAKSDVRAYRANRKPTFADGLYPRRAQAGWKKLRAAPGVRFLRAFGLSLRATFTHSIALAAPAGVGQGQGVTEHSHSLTTESESPMKNQTAQTAATATKPSIYQVVTDRIRSTHGQ